MTRVLLEKHRPNFSFSHLGLYTSLEASWIGRSWKHARRTSTLSEWSPSSLLVLCVYRYRTRVMFDFSSLRTYKLLAYIVSNGNTFLQNGRPGLLHCNMTLHTMSQVIAEVIDPVVKCHCIMRRRIGHAFLKSSLTHLTQGNFLSNNKLYSHAYLVSLNKASFFLSGRFINQSHFYPKVFHLYGNFKPNQRSRYSTTLLYFRRSCPNMSGTPFSIVLRSNASNTFTVTGRTQGVM